jgi:hypothetical protein
VILSYLNLTYILFHQIVTTNIIHFLIIWFMHALGSSCAWGNGSRSGFLSSAPCWALLHSILIPLLLKAIILKYGGPLLYTRLRPFFLGLVLGAFGTAGIWLIIDLCTGMTGNRLISIS